MSADYKVHGDVAVITMNNPPVNGLGYATRKGITDGLAQANADAAVKASVLTGAGKAFSGGADIKEFGSPKALAEPNLLSVILALEAASKPIVAAIHSVCMGGGLELALGCHYRIAAKGTQVALPEVKIGLIPGAGGTQRLPRLCGVPLALDMCVGGNPVPAGRALTAGIIDRTVDGDRHVLLSAAATFAQDRARATRIRRTCDLPASPDATVALGAAPAKLGRALGGGDAAADQQEVDVSVRHGDAS